MKIKSCVNRWPAGSWMQNKWDALRQKMKGEKSMDAEKTIKQNRALNPDDTFLV